MLTTQRFLSENMKSVMVSLSEWGTGNGANVFCFLSSLHLLPPVPHLSTLNQHCITGAGLPIHLIGEVSWDPK
jgi:hypothetical protein